MVTIQENLPTPIQTLETTSLPQASWYFMQNGSQLLNQNHAPEQQNGPIFTDLNNLFTNTTTTSAAHHQSTLTILFPPLLITYLHIVALHGSMHQTVDRSVISAL